MIIQKYGGTSMTCMEKVYENILESKKKHQSSDIIVVVSAIGNKTKKLVNMVKSISSQPNKRENDALISLGENLSSVMLSLYLNNKGLSSVSLNAFQISLKIKNGELISIDENKIQKHLNKGQVVIVTGYQGINEYGDIELLPKNGSDITAIFLAHKFNVDMIDIFTDVDGIYPIDPNKVKCNNKLEYISKESMLQLSKFGAQVVHEHALKLAIKYNIDIHLRSTFTKKNGTIIGDKHNHKDIIFICADENISVVNTSLPNKPGMLLQLYEKYGKYIDGLIQTGKSNTKSILYIVKNENVKYINIQKQNIENNLCKITIYSQNNLNIEDIFHIISENNCNIQYITSEPKKISFFLNKIESDNILRKLYDYYYIK